MKALIVTSKPFFVQVTFDCDRCKKFLCELEGDSVDAEFKCGHQLCDQCFEAHEDR